jgi:acetyl esterase/lipase
MGAHTSRAANSNAPKEEAMMNRASGLTVVLALASFGTPASSQEGSAPNPSQQVYAQPGGVELAAYVFKPAGKPSDRPRAAIVLFHGGGWHMGEPSWAFDRAQHFADHGMVAVAVQYRLSDQKEVTPAEAFEDARTAMRWVRSHAHDLAVDPKRIAAYGWSAGAHLAASTAVFAAGAADATVSCAPNALVLVSPAVSVTSEGWFGRLLGSRGDPRDLSPAEHVRSGLPPNGHRHRTPGHGHTTT